MNERELIALEDLCDTLHKEVADLEKERRELKEKDIVKVWMSGGSTQAPWSQHATRHLRRTP